LEKNKMLGFSFGSGRLWIHPKLYFSRRFQCYNAFEGKKRVSIVRDPSREKMEDLISALELIDVPPIKGKYTWNNLRDGPVHIVARLDRFPISSSFLSLHETFSSSIIP